MFSGTLRENVDPLCHFTDEQVKDALQQVALGTKALTAEVGISGAGWSLGEKQLVSVISNQSHELCRLCARSAMLPRCRLSCHATGLSCSCSSQEAQGA